MCSVNEGTNWVETLARLQSRQKSNYFEIPPRRWGWKNNVNFQPILNCRRLKGEERLEERKNKRRVLKHLITLQPVSRVLLRTCACLFISPLSSRILMKRSKTGHSSSFLNCVPTIHGTMSTRLKCGAFSVKAEPT